MAASVKTRVGVIGCGDISRAHLTGYISSGRATVVAVADTLAHAANERAAQFSVDGVYEDYREMLDREDMDAVSVCTPPPSHREIVAAAARQGMHVLCEKPLAMSVAEGEELVTAARRSGVILMTALCQRFFEHVMKARGMVAAGKLGEVHQFRFRRGEKTSYEHSWIGDPDMGGGLFWESGVHSADMFRFLVGEAAAVYARGVTRTQAIKGADTISMVLEGERGELGMVEQSWSSPHSENRIEVHGELGSIAIDHNTGRGRFSDTNGTRWLQTSEKRIDRFIREIAHFLDCVEGRAEPIMTGVDGVEAMRVMEAAMQSARDGKRVIIRGRAAAG